MKPFFAALLFVLVAGGAYLVAANDFIRTESKTYVVAKKALGLEHTFTDTTSWGPLDWAQNPVIVEAQRAEVEAAKASAEEAVAGTKKELGLGAD